MLVPVFERDGEAHVVLTRRPHTMAHHQGEVAFPGGKVDPAVDSSARDAALREAEEEIGLPKSAVDVVAELDALQTFAGPFLIALHGGGYSARSWADRGFVDKLKERFTMITPDQRGIADSDKPTTLEGYALDKMLDDVLAVADAAGAKRFHLWGFGHGATIGRYLAARSDRVISAVLVSADFVSRLPGSSPIRIDS